MNDFPRIIDEYDIGIVCCRNDRFIDIIPPRQDRISLQLSSSLPVLMGSFAT